MKFPTCEEKKKIEKTHAKEKQSHAQDNIYVVRQFAYIYEVAGISLLSKKKKNTKCGYSVSVSQKTTTTTTNPNHQNRFLHPAHRIHNELQNGLPKPPLHGLSFRKSPIKNRATLFGSGRVQSSNRIKYN